MRYIVTPEFSQKVVSAAQSIRAVGDFLNFVEGADKERIVADRAITMVAVDVLYTYERDGVKIFFSFGNDKNGEYLLAVDIVLIDPNSNVMGSQPRLKDPNTDSSINPLRNGQLNPNFNGQLNPKFNGTINPIFNGRLNPKFNGAINPKFNGAISYRFNGAINPRFNSAVNPKTNWAINPLKNKVLTGPFLYDLKSQRDGFGVKPNDQVMLLFSLSAEFVGVAVSSDIGGYVVFDLNDNWIGHWVSHPAEGYLRFDTNNEWIGFVTL